MTVFLCEIEVKDNGFGVLFEEKIEAVRRFRRQIYRGLVLQRIFLLPNTDASGDIVKEKDSAIIAESLFL